jgi:hypothetical protein
MIAACHPVQNVPCLRTSTDYMTCVELPQHGGWETGGPKVAGSNPASPTPKLQAWRRAPRLRSTADGKTASRSFAPSRMAGCSSSLGGGSALSLASRMRPWPTSVVHSSRVRWRVQMSSAVKHPFSRRVCRTLLIASASSASRSSRRVAVPCAISSPNITHMTAPASAQAAAAPWRFRPELEVARLLGVNPKTVNSWSDEGLPSHRTIGGHRRYRWGDVTAWLRRPATQAG